LTNDLTRVELATCFIRVEIMHASIQRRVIAFHQFRLIASGPLVDVVRALKHTGVVGTDRPLLLFDEQTSRPLDVDLRGTVDEVLARLQLDECTPEPVVRGPGRPKLGVVPREVTLLPRHWDWLGQQPGGASAVLRQLVEQALRSSGAATQAREAAESVDRFMLAMTGDFADHEEASRAFYRGDHERFAALTESWPVDIRKHLRHLAGMAWTERCSS
jgi:hypothetical protein